MLILLFFFTCIVLFSFLVSVFLFLDVFSILILMGLISNIIIFYYFIIGLITIDLVFLSFLVIEGYMIIFLIFSVFNN